MAKKKQIHPAPGMMFYHNDEFMDSEAGRPLRILCAVRP